MIILSLLLMIILFIAAGATQFWLLAIIGAGIFIATVLMYVMATNDVVSAIVTTLVAIGAPILYFTLDNNWILIVSYIAIGLWMSSDTIMSNDVYSEWTIEGKIFYFWDELGTDFLIHLYSFIFTVVWGGLALLGIKFNWFLIIPTLYLVVRSVIVLIKCNDYRLSHSFNLFHDAGNFFSSLGRGIKNFFTGGRSSGRTMSWWNFIVPILIVGLSVGLVLLERNNSYSNFAENILGMFDLFESTKWFHFTSSIWNFIPEATDNLSESLLFFGDILNIPVAIILFVATLVVAVIEAVLSLVWILICLIFDYLIAFIIGALLLYIVPVLLPVGLLVLLILSFSLNHSILNRSWNFICLLIGIIGCYYYFTFMTGGTPIVPIPF